MLPQVVAGDPAASEILVAKALKPREMGKHTATREMTSTGVYSERDIKPGDYRPTHRGQSGIRRWAGLGVVASLKFMRIPCFGSRMTIGRASIVWPGTSRKSYFLSRTLRIMK